MVCLSRSLLSRGIVLAPHFTAPLTHRRSLRHERHPYFHPAGGIGRQFRFENAVAGQSHHVLNRGTPS